VSRSPQTRSTSSPGDATGSCTGRAPPISSASTDDDPSGCARTGTEFSVLTEPAGCRRPLTRSLGASILKGGIRATRVRRQRRFLVIPMQAVTGYRRRSMIALGVMLVGVVVTVPSAVAQGVGGADKAAPGAPTQRFLAIGTDPEENTTLVLGFGPIHAKGVDKAVTNHKDVFRFPKGSVVVRHQRVAGHRDHDPATCLFRFFERGTYQVVRGTGNYVGAHGHGHYVLRGKFVACQQGPPDVFVFQIWAHGPLRL
jgi:hypothetical protein